MKLAVIGAGAMGSGIAQLAGMHGLDVLLLDENPQAIQKGIAAIQSSLARLASKSTLTEDPQKILSRIQTVSSFTDIADTDFVIEAIVENEEIKKQLFARLNDILSPACIVASNTSSLSVTALASVFSNPERFIGIHFFNPPVLMELVEIIPALQTSSATIEKSKALISNLKKTAVQALDTPGFIVNRIARPFYGEALRIAEERLAHPAFIDNAMKQLGFKMGPFELMDFIGNDVNEAVTRSVWTAMHFDPRYKPSFLQINLVRAGWLGRKTGKGFYVYNNQSTLTEEKQTILSFEEIQDRILVMLINEAADACHLGIASKEDIDLAMKLGVNYPKGLLQWADEFGIEKCIDQMDALFSRYHDTRYRCSPLLRDMGASKRKFFA